MIYFTELDNLPTFDARGEYMGRLTDLAVDPSQNSLQVAAYLVKRPTKSTLCISHEQIQSVSVRAAQTRVAADQIRCYGPEEGLLRVKRSEEHTSELQSLAYLVCRLLLEKKKINREATPTTTPASQISSDVP